MSESVVSTASADFFNEVFRPYVGAESAAHPVVDRDAVDRLLSDDTARRMTQGRLAAMEWGTADAGAVVITDEHLLITDEGLMYAARLDGPGRASGERRSLYYLATPAALFDAVVDGADHLDRTALRWRASAAVDRRLEGDLRFPWPLDVVLRRTLTAVPVLWVSATSARRESAVSRS